MFSYCISPSAAGLGVPEIPPVPSSNAGTSHALSTGWLLGRVSDPTSAQYNSGSQEPKQGNSLLVQSCCPELLAHPAALLLLKLSSPGVQEVWGGLCCSKSVVSAQSWWQSITSGPLFIFLEVHSKTTKQHLL